MPGRARPAGSMLAALAVAALASSPTPTLALDAQVQAETTLRVYDVRSPAADVFWTRRRLVQRLDLQLVQPVGEGRPDRPPTRVRASIDLRLNRELGDTCLVSTPSRCFAVTDRGLRASYEPLVNDGGIDLPQARVEASDPVAGWSLSAGRQLVWDPIGMLRIDGAHADVAPLSWLALDAQAGLLVRSSRVAGVDSFVPAGPARLDLPETDQQRAEHVLPPLDTFMYGGSVAVGSDDVVRVAAHYRQLGDRDGVVQRSIAASLGSQAVPTLRIDAHAVYDPIDARVVDAHAGVRGRGARVQPHARLSRRVPRFDRGSIWAYFDPSALWEAAVGSDLVLIAGPDYRPPPLQIGADVRARRFDDLPAAQRDDLGLQGHVDFAHGRHRVWLSGFGWRAGLGPLWGADLQASHQLSERFTLSPRVSAFRLYGVDAGMSGAAVDGVGAAEACALSMRASPEAELTVEIVHSHGDAVGSRVSALAYLRVGAWR